MAVYFNCYPNFSVDINDPNVMDSLTLNVKTKNLNSKINTREIAIIYRVYYRLMKTHLAPKARIKSLKGETKLMEANHEHSSTFVILVSFYFCPSRPVPRPPSSSKTPKKADDDEIISVVNNSKSKVTRVDFSGNVPKVFYQDLLGSPTASEMEPPKDNKPAWLGMLKTSQTFEPNPNILHEQWIHPDNQVKRKWYVAPYTLKQRESFRDLWMAEMRRIDCEIEFFKWFEMTGRIENCVESLQVIINKWYTTSNKVVESITPPLEGINIPIVGTMIKASPFKEKTDKTSGLLTSADIDRVVEQNNYSNQILHVISRQIEDTKPTISRRPTPASTSSSHNIENYPGFKIPEFSKEKFPKLSDTFKVTGNIIEKINAQLNNFNISVKDDKTPNKVSTLHEEPISQEKSNLFKKFARRSITKWNIDCLAEHQAYNKLHEMGVAITAYKMHGSANRDAANMLVADKVRTKIQDRNNGNIPYGKLTYDDLVSTINVVALELCIDIKLKHQLKKEQSSSRKELGSFCGDFGFITPPNKIKKIKRKNLIGRNLEEEMILPDQRKKNIGPTDLEIPSWMFVGHVERSAIKPANADQEPKRRKSIFLRYQIFGVTGCTHGHYLRTVDGLTVRPAASDTNYGRPAQTVIRSTVRSFTLSCMLSTSQVMTHTCATSSRDVPCLRLGDSSGRDTKSSGTSDEYNEDEDIDLDYDSDKSQYGKNCTCTEAFCTCDSSPHIRVSSLKEEIRNIKYRLCIVETDILTNQVPKRTTLQDFESDQNSSQENDKTDVVLPNINNDHLIEPLVTNTGNDTSTSAAPGVTVISSIRPQSHHIPVKIVVSKHFVINKIALLYSGADRNCIVKETSKFLSRRRLLFLELMFELNICAKLEGYNINGAHQITIKFGDSYLEIAKLQKKFDEEICSDFPNDAKVDVCWTCGKTGHKANEYRSKTKKKKINLLNIDEETKGKLLVILDEHFSESSGTSDEYSDDENIDLDYNSNVSQSGKYCTCTEAFCTYDCTPHIRVLSDHSKEALFDVIQHINDNEDRNRVLLELKNLLLKTDKPKTRPIIQPFNMKQIMNRSDSHFEPSISYHRHEDSSHEYVDDNIGIDLSNINNEHLAEPFVTNTDNDTSTSAAPGITTNVDRIQYMCKQIQVKGWISKQPNANVQDKAKLSKKLSKAALKQKLKEAMDNLDDYDENQIMRMIEDAASTESSSEDNVDMCNPKGLALAYMEPDYE
ncbi:hypothetical protein KY285_006342 [Solanum tuberosum]|nr:hypothetical protein KY285_006342 [Solanum tuberosum]